MTNSPSPLPDSFTPAPSMPNDILPEHRRMIDALVGDTTDYDYQSFPAERRESAIYFMGVRGFIKIGWTVNWRKRLSNLQTANPEPLEILLILGRPQIFEKTMHRQFAAHRKSGEWFCDHPDIRAYIETRKHECWYRAGRR